MSYQYLNNFVKQFPEIWKQSCPRIIKGADSFGDIQAASTAIAVNLLVNADKNFNDESTRRCAEVAVKLVEKNVPVFYIAEDFARAAFLSNPPNDLRWSEINLPFESAVLIPPKNFFTHSEFGNLDFIAYARIQKGEILKTPEQVNQFKNGHFTIFTAFKDEPNFPQQQRTLTENKTPLIADGVFTSEQKFLGFEEYELSPFAKYMTLEDGDLMDNLFRFTFSVLLAINSRPQLVSRGVRAGRHKKSNLPIWTPNIVGSLYRTQTERGGDGAGSVSANRLHWRRGHFRRQPFGSHANHQHKIIWLEPVLVGENNEK